MEQEIFKIIMGMIYDDKLEEMYENRSQDITFPLNIKLNPNIKVLCDFNQRYFNKYEEILVNNALVYALRKNDKEYLTFFKENINKLRQVLSKETMFHIKTTEYGFKNILDKIFNKQEFNEIINSNKALFDLLNNNYKRINTITSCYKNILYNIINKYPGERENIIDLILTSDEFDEYIVSSGFINKDFIKDYKEMIARIILSEAYLFVIDLMDINDDEKHILEENLFHGKGIKMDELDDDDLEELYHKIDMDILNHINKCIKDDNIYLPNDYTLRLNIYSKFLTYNLYKHDIDKKEFLKVLDEEPNCVTVLRKINPLYRIDFIDLN